jgi:GH24 family phage-related lysozyme (muramidase)
LKAYWDFKQWSIWYGTPSYKWEVITSDEADKRWRQRIQSIRDKYNLQDYSIDVQKAVVSFAYNIWSLNKKQVNLLKNEYYRALWNDFIQYNKITIDWEKVIAWWLVKRRQAEFNLLIK